MSAKQTQTGRGFAAARGVRIPSAEAVGATVPSLHKRPARDWRTTCNVQGCANAEQDGLVWCSFHIARAARLGVSPPRSADVSEHK